jgi:hypothetical protein
MLKFVQHPPLSALFLRKVWLCRVSQFNSLIMKIIFLRIIGRKGSRITNKAETSLTPPWAFKKVLSLLLGLIHDLPIEIAYDSHS